MAKKRVWLQGASVIVDEDTGAVLVELAQPLQVDNIEFTGEQLAQEGTLQQVRDKLPAGPATADGQQAIVDALGSPAPPYTGIVTGAMYLNGGVSENTSNGTGLSLAPAVHTGITIDWGAWSDPYGDTTFDVSDASGLSVGDELFLNDGNRDVAAPEMLRITNIAGNTLTVDRGYLGTQLTELHDGMGILRVLSEPLPCKRVRLQTSARHADPTSYDGFYYSGADGFWSGQVLQGGPPVDVDIDDASKLRIRATFESTKVSLVSIVIFT